MLWFVLVDTHFNSDHRFSFGVKIGDWWLVFLQLFLCLFGCVYGVILIFNYLVESSICLSKSETPGRGKQANVLNVNLNSNFCPCFYDGQSSIVRVEGYRFSHIICNESVTVVESTIYHFLTFLIVSPFDWTLEFKKFYFIPEQQRNL